MFSLIPKHSSVTNVRRVQTNLIFFYLLIRTDGLVLFISLSHLKFSSNWKLPEIVWNQAWNKETWGALTVLIKISLCSIHVTVVIRNNIEVITYSYGRGNTSVYFWSPYFFFPGFLFPVTQICQSVDLVVNFSSLLLLSWLLVYSFTDRNRTQKVTGQNSRSLVVEALFLFTLKVSLTRLGIVIFQQTIVSLFYCI